MAANVKIGILLVNLGSPSEPTAEAVRKYLGQFLHDKRVIDTSRWIWCPILHGIILRTRPAKSAAKYAEVWDQPDGFPGTEAPLVRITRAQAAGLKSVVGERTLVEIGMRYGEPSIASGLAALKAQGCARIIALPLYPQFSHTTTSAVKDAIDKAVAQDPDMPTISMLDDYHVHADYIQALTNSLKQHVRSLAWSPDKVLLSYHGLPKRYVDKGDPYADQCRATTEHMIAAIGQTPYDIQMAFQSRFGALEWLQPYTDKTLESLAQSGHKNIVVMTPGFASDCLETLEEIALEAEEIFQNAGGENFSLVPCLNASEDHIALMATLLGEMSKSA